VILVDSSVWIAHLRGSWTVATAKLEAAAGREPILVGDLILLEVLQGARDEAKAARASNAACDASMSCRFSTPISLHESPGTIAN
jgi:predicted nucleic acid-binding protein